MVQATTLPNGLTVLSDPMPGVATVAVGLYADTGSRLEAAEQNGLAHLFEHMVFKGAAGRSARAIAEAIEDVGGQLNAWTARDMTVFHARALASDLSLAVELIAGLVTAPDFDAGELEKERQVVLQELGEARDTPDDIVFDHLQAAAFPDQPIGRPVLGDEGTLAAIGPDALHTWRQGQYRAGSLVLAAAGAVEHAVLVALAQARLGGLPAGRRPDAAPAMFAPGAAHDCRRSEAAHVTLAWPGPGFHDPDLPAALLFTAAAGGGMSSRLFQELREERGLVYSVFAQHQPYDDCGLMSVYLAAAPCEAGKARALAEQVLADTAAGLDQAELDRARAQLRAGLLMGLEGCQGRADHSARSWLTHGRVMDPAEWLARLDAVSVEAARAAGAAMLGRGQARAIVGPKRAA